MFWDSSALVPLIFAEARSADLVRAASADKELIEDPGQMLLEL